MSLFLANSGIVAPASAAPLISIVAAGAIASDTSGTGDTTPTPPTHQADDILIAVAQNHNASAMSTATAGWNIIFEGAGSGARVGFWWKRATGAGTGGPQITAALAHQHAIVFAVRGCVTSGTPFEDDTMATANSITPSTSLITTLGPNRLAACFHSESGSIRTFTGYPPSPWDSKFVVSTAVGFTGVFRALSTHQASAGNVAAATIGNSSPSNSVWSTLTLAFIPA